MKKVNKLTCLLCCGIMLFIPLFTQAASKPRTQASLALVANTDEKDSLPRHDIDVTRIPNPIPRKEPPSELGNPEFYEVYGQRYYVDKTTVGYRAHGYASWYGTKFHGKRTSSGEPYDMYSMTAASKTLPIPCYVRVSNLENGKHVIVRVNDRGPFHKNRIIDLSYTAAKKLGMIGKGTAYVRVDALAPHQALPTNFPSRAVASTAPQKGWYLQIGAFGERINAENLAQDIRKIVRVPVQISKVAFAYGTYYRVKVGPFKTSQDGTRVSKILKLAGLSHGVLTNT